jgi:hypothetical protein
MNRYFELLLNEGREILLKHLPASSCVSSTRFAVECLKLQGYEAYPLPVHVVIPSPFIIIGRNPSNIVPQGNWNGHLVAIVENELLLDMTLDQTGILPAAVFELKDFPMACQLGDHVVIYFKDCDFAQFESSAAWMERWKPAFEEWQNMNLKG